METMIYYFIGSTLTSAIPLLLATNGEILTEKAGVLNLGVEGMMALGALGAFAVSYFTGNFWLGVLAGSGTAGVLAAIHGITSVYLRANQTVSGLAVTMVGVGLAGFWGRGFISQKLPEGFDVPDFGFLAQIPGIGPVASRLDVFFLISILLALLTWFILVYTRLGLWIRCVGENPKAAEAQGIPVAAVRFWAVVVGGLQAGAAGAFLSLSFSASWLENMTGGRGWVAVALTILALWNPLRALWAAGLFGLLFVLQFTLQPFGISSALLEMIPYAATLVVLILDGLARDHRILGAPAALGEPYRKEER